MKHSQIGQPEPAGFGFARVPSDSFEPCPAQPPPLSENDYILASSALQEASALHGQPEYDRIAERFRAQADHSRLGLTPSEGGGGARGQADGAQAREELRIKARWEGRMQALNLGTRALLIVLLAWVIWENRGLKAEIRQAQEAVEFLAEAYLRLAEEVRSTE